MTIDLPCLLDSIPSGPYHTNDRSLLKKTALGVVALEVKFRGRSENRNDKLPGLTSLGGFGETIRIKPSQYVKLEIWQ
jgi:hypothetical protein